MSSTSSPFVVRLFYNCRIPVSTAQTPSPRTAWTLTARGRSLSAASAAGILRSRPSSGRPRARRRRPGLTVVIHGRFRPGATAVGALGRRPVRSSSSSPPSSLPGVSDSWPTTGTAGTSGRSPARRPSRSASDRNRSTPHSNHGMSSEMSARALRRVNARSASVSSTRVGDQLRRHLEGADGASATALPATAAPVDHACRTGWGRTVRPTSAGRGLRASWRAAGRPRRSARLTNGSRRTGRGLVVWRRSRAEGGPGGSQRDRGGPSSTEWGRRLERAAATPAVVARRTARPGPP